MKNGRAIPCHIRAVSSSQISLPRCHAQCEISAAHGINKIGRGLPRPSLYQLLLIFSFTYCENASAAGESDMLFSFIM